MKQINVLLIFVALMLAPIVSQARVAVGVQVITAVTATGGGTDTDISRFTRDALFTCQSLNTAGTNPTLAAKLQTASKLGLGYSQQTAGTTVNILRAGATTTNKLAAVITNGATAVSIKSVTLMLKKVGTITSGKITQLDVFTTSSSLPTTTLGTATTVGTDSISTSAYVPITFTFPTPVDVAANAVYAFVLSGDYTASGSNYVSWRSLTVASAGTQATFDATTWTAVATESFEVYVGMQYSAFADITGGGFASATTGSSGLSSVALWADDLSQVVRTYFTVGGTSNPSYYVSVTLNGDYKSTP